MRCTSWRTHHYGARAGAHTHTYTIAVHELAHTYHCDAGAGTHIIVTPVLAHTIVAPVLAHTIVAPVLAHTIVAPVLAHTIVAPVLAHTNNIALHYTDGAQLNTDGVIQS